MRTQVQTLQEDHARLRALLQTCEGASPPELEASLRRLEEIFVPHRRAKVALYEDSLQACQLRGDKTSVTVLNIFRANMNVMGEAILGFLRFPDPHPERLLQRFRTVSSTLRSMMDSEEKVVFPLFLRHARREGSLS